MIIIYPIGLPCLYLSLLWWSKDKIRDKANEESNSKANPSKSKVGSLRNLTGAVKLVSIVDGISFLFQSYTPEYWYWEVIECTRRLMLTAAISFFQPGSSTQMVVAMTLALIYVSLYAHYQPYLSRSDNVLSELGQWQIFITFFCALLISK